VERNDALQQAIAEISRQRLEIERLRSGAREPIAIVGMACRLPGAPDVEAYWDLLARGGDAIATVPADRWHADRYFDPDASAVGKMVTRQGGFIQGADQFDAAFFGIAPREAQSMDPQQRLLLEVAWEALEHANIAPSDLYGTATGVFVGITCFDHAIRISQATENFNAYAGTGSALNMAPGRLSYVLGLNGPSMAVDTACSSSLVCLHLACQSLRERESNAAIVGGVHLILSPDVMVSFSQARMLAPDGRSKTFDGSADGYARGEGCGVVVLKRLSDAIADRDAILGVIRGTAVNQDGPSGGLTVPNGAAQQQVIRRALDRAGIPPSSVQYVEAHATGTSLGDPIEVEALAKVYGAGRSREQALLVGSVKTNIGHLEPAAGVAGLIKLLLAFRHEVIPQHLHFKTPNPHVPWADIPVRVAAQATPWPRADQPRIAGLSAFGFSGTNAHVIVEEPPAPPVVALATDRRQQLLPISARSDAALRTLALRYIERLSSAADAGADADADAGDADHAHSADDSNDLRAIAYTAGIGRAHLPFRLAVLASNVADARAALMAFVEGRTSPAWRSGKAAHADYRRDGKDVRARLDGAYARRDADALADLARLYVEGVAIDWERLHAPAPPRRVSVPGYPFERQRYWTETSAPPMPADTADTAFAPWLYKMVWTRLGSALSPDESLAGGGGRRWMIEAGDAALAEALRQLIGSAVAHDAAGATDVLVLAGARDAGESTAECVRLLRLSQSLVAAGATPRIWVVTRGALPVAGEMTTSGAAQAPLAAFARGIGLEHPELFGRVIDLGDVAGANDAASVLAEILDGDAEDRVAIRDGGRFGERVERASEPRWDAGSVAAAILRADATYLVTGGLGRIGLLVAADLARRGARHLCVISRSGPVTAVQRSAIAAIASSGAQVQVATVDVADRDAMAALINGLTAERPIAGIVHAAGVPGYTDLVHMTADELADVLRPKVAGTWLLHDLTRDQPLEFFAGFSSIAAAWGSRGQAHYAAGNAYVDALAHVRRSSGMSGVAINWGPWADGGMTSPEAATLLARVGIRPLATPAALAALAALATDAPPQIVVADIDWALFKGSYEARGHRRLLERIGLADGPAGHAESPLIRALRDAGEAGALRQLTEIVQREVVEVLALSGPLEADPQQGLFEMGMDSLMALELRTRLQTIASRALPATLVFDYPSIDAIARFVLTQMTNGSDAAAGGGVTELAAAALAPASGRHDHDKLDALSDEDAEALLLKKLDSLR
jgi:acyl transferase domain-containing protein